MDIKYKILMSLVLVLAFSFSFSSAEISKWDYTPTGTQIINGSNYSINVNNTNYHQGLTAQQVANLAPYNSTQFDSAGYIKTSWLTSFIEGLSKWNNYALISNLVSLVGNWTADKTNYYNTTQVDTLVSSAGGSQDYINEDIFEHDFCTTANIKQTVGTLSTSNIALCSYYIQASATTLGSDAMLNFMGVGASTGTTTGLAYRNPALTTLFYGKGRWASEVEPTSNITWIFGAYKTGTAYNMNTLSKMLGFFYNNTGGDRSIYGRACSAAGSCTLTATGFPIAKNNQFEFKMEGNQAITRNAEATNYTFYIRLTNSPTWTYLGYIDTNFPSDAANAGIWVEHQGSSTINSRFIIDKVVIKRNSDYYTY